MDASIESQFIANDILINDLRIHVGIRFSKFVSFKREEQERPVILNQRHMERFLSSFDAIETALKKETESEFSLNLTATKTLSISDDAEPKLQMIQTTPRLTEVDLDLEEFQSLMEEVPRLRMWMMSNVVYKHPDGTTWSLHPDRAREGHAAIAISQLWTRLVSKVCDKCLIFYLKAHLIHGKVQKLAAQNCYGCKNDRPGQKDHMEAGCLSEISEQVSAYYEEADRAMNFTSFLSRLCTNMNWPVSKLPKPSHALVERILCGDMEIICEGCRPLKPLYEDLFTFLAFEVE